MKIAAPVERALARRRETGCAGSPQARVLASGDGWSVADVVCASGPGDRPFEEVHAHYSIAIVAAGLFRYRTALGGELMTPGSLLLGACGQSFECGHEHGAGDRCIAFWYDAERFERVAADIGVRGRPTFARSRMPPRRELAGTVARAIAGITGARPIAWEELGVELAARTLQLVQGTPGGRVEPTPRVVARVAAIARAIDDDPATPFDLTHMSRDARVSPYHFLRSFERVTGVTPHQYLMRARLREAGRRLAAERAKILDVALDCGFTDVSNFNHAFLREFGVTPTRWAR